MEKSNDLIGDRTRDLTTCSIVPQPSAVPRASDSKYMRMPVCKCGVN
jgi:hypothetical protein